MTAPVVEVPSGDRIPGLRMEYKRFIPLFAFVIFCIAAYRLYYALSAYERAKIVQAIFAIPPARLGLGALFVAGSYLSLTLFDTLAIRYIGAKLPYRRIALASFTALSIGHTLGAWPLLAAALSATASTPAGASAQPTSQRSSFSAL